jgi:hypothetical protein
MLSTRLVVPWLKQLVTGFSPQKPGFKPGSVHVGFVVEKVALGQVFLQVLWFSPVSIIPPLLSKLISSVRFQVLTAASVKLRIFWDVLPCSQKILSFISSGG